MRVFRFSDEQRETIIRMYSQLATSLEVAAAVSVGLTTVKLFKASLGTIPRDAVFVQQIKDTAAAGYTGTEIAALFGVTTTIVVRAVGVPLRDIGPPRGPVGRRKGLLTRPGDSTIRRLVAEGASWDEIAAATGYTKRGAQTRATKIGARSPRVFNKAESLARYRLRQAKYMRLRRQAKLALLGPEQTKRYRTQKAAEPRAVKVVAVAKNLSSSEAIAEFIARKGVTRLPPAACAPTTGTIPEAARVTLAAYHQGRDMSYGWRAVQGRKLGAIAETQSRLAA